MTINIAIKAKPKCKTWQRQ